MRGIKRTICALCLLALFVAYQASITAFTHVHYVNGVLITHSHPFHNQHSHSTDSLIVIGLLSHFSSDTPDCCELQHPSVAGDGKRNRYTRHKGKSVSDALSPRSPLFRYPLIVLYQRLVCSIPTLGIRCTDAWYSMYQSLVLAVPMFGIRRTCLWYLPYQVPVQNWYH